VLQNPYDFVSCEDIFHQNGRSVNRERSTTTQMQVGYSISSRKASYIGNGNNIYDSTPIIRKHQNTICMSLWKKKTTWRRRSRSEWIQSGAIDPWKKHINAVKLGYAPYSNPDLAGNQPSDNSSDTPRSRDGVIERELIRSIKEIYRKR